MAMAFSQCLRNTNQKIPHNILRKNYEISAFNIKPFLCYAQKNYLGGAQSAPHHPESDKVNLRDKLFSNVMGVKLYRYI